MFKGETRDYIVINKQGCAPWASLHFYYIIA